MEQPITASIRILNLDGSEATNLIRSLLSTNWEGVELYEFYPIYASTTRSKKMWKLVGSASQVLGVLANLVTIATSIETDTKPEVNVRIDNSGHDNTFTFIGAGAHEAIQTAIKQKEDTLRLLKLQLDIDQTKKEIEEVQNSPLYRKLK